jgi:hypothetical protein
MRGAGISALREPSEVLELVDEQEPPAPAAHADIEPTIPAALREAVPLVVSGAIQVLIVETYPHSSLPEAVLHTQRGGKVFPELGGAA